MKVARAVQTALLEPEHGVGRRVGHEVRIRRGGIELHPDPYTLVARHGAEIPNQGTELLPCTRTRTRTRTATLPLHMSMGFIFRHRRAASRAKREGDNARDANEQACPPLRDQFL